jgi:hypothetical protein
MKLTMVDSAQRNCELIRYLSAQCALLGKSDVMRVRRLPATHCARLRGDEANVTPVAIAAIAPAPLCSVRFSTPFGSV